MTSHRRPSFTTYVSSYRLILLAFQITIPFFSKPFHLSRRWNRTPPRQGYECTMPCASSYSDWATERLVIRLLLSTVWVSGLHVLPTLSIYFTVHVTPHHTTHRHRQSTTTKILNESMTAVNHQHFTIWIGRFLLKNKKKKKDNNEKKGKGGTWLVVTLTVRQGSGKRLVASCLLHARRHHHRELPESSSCSHNKTFF